MTDEACQGGNLLLVVILVIWYGLCGCGVVFGCFGWLDGFGICLVV